MTTLQPSINISHHPSHEQHEQIYEILNQVFPVGRAYFQQRLDSDTSYDPNTTWFATVNGTVASTIQIFPLHIRVGKASLKIGGIGSVGTDPNFRGLSLAHKILHAQVDWMKQNDYDLCPLLAIIHPFYERVGWKVIPEQAYSIARPALTQHTSGQNIISFDVAYIDHLQEIYEQFNNERTYTAIRNKAYWNDLLNWPAWDNSDCLLLRKDNKIVAYGIIAKTADEKAAINELAYVQEAEEDVIELFHALCQLRPDAKHITAKLPDDHRLAAYFKENDAESIELNVTMWKMINLASIFHKLQPELEARLQQSKKLANKSLHIALHCADESIHLKYEAQQLTIDTAETIGSLTAHYQKVAVDEHRLISYILYGYSDDAHSGTTHELLQALFPKQNAIFYNTDKF